MNTNEKKYQVYYRYDPVWRSDPIYIICTAPCKIAVHKRLHYNMLYPTNYIKARGKRSHMHGLICRECDRFLLQEEEMKTIGIMARISGIKGILSYLDGIGFVEVKSGETIKKI